MVGITSYGAYVPLWRLSRQAMAKNAKGEKPICNFDEDTITMAAAAAIDCVQGLEREAVDGLLFASTNAPYLEKQAASIVAAAADLRRNLITADFASSLKAGTTALRFAADAVKAGSAKQVMVTAAVGENPVPETVVTMPSVGLRVIPGSPEASGGGATAVRSSLMFPPASHVADSAAMASPSPTVKTTVFPA